MNRFFKSAMASACLGLLLCAGAPVGAQTVQTLSIYDGTLTINGEEIPEADLPADLDLRGIRATYTFIGKEARPLIELNGVLYLLDGTRIRNVDELRDQEGGLSVFFRPDNDETAILDHYGKRKDQALLSTTLARQQSQALQAHTEELARLSYQVEQQPANQALEKARVQVAQAAQAVQLLPKLEVQSYLSDVQQYNHTLYGMLVQEWRMERDAELLAQTIRQLPEGQLHTSYVTQLQEKLQAVFELKQQNRRLEIEQLEQQLSALNERLQKREEWRETLIRQRLEQLIGPPRARDRR